MNTSAFVEELRSSSIGQQILKERDEREFAERQAVADERVTLRAKLATICKKRDPEIAKADAAARDQRERFIAAQSAYSNLVNTRRSEIGAVEAQIRKLDRELLATANPKIEAARHEMFARRDRERNKMAQNEIRKTGKVMNISGRAAVQHFTNQPAIERLVAAIHAARSGFDELQLQNPKDVDAAIAGVLADVSASWDSLGEMTPIGEPGPIQGTGWKW